MTQRFDIASEITSAILARLEAGTKPWAQPWTGAPPSRPLRYCGTPYRGINILLLWMAADVQGYTSPWWMSYRQAAQLGGQVRKGEKATRCIFYKQLDARSDGGEGEANKHSEDIEHNEASDAVNKGTGRVLRSFAVFNADQIDELPERFSNSLKVRLFQDDAGTEPLSALLARIPVTTIHQGAAAYYRPSTDVITLPAIADFRDYPSYAATRLHEAAHATGHVSRLARDFGARFGSNAYAFEELIAEMASAIVGAALGLPTRLLDNHASYLASWIKILKSDRSAVLSAAARGQDASDMILNWLGCYNAVVDAQMSAEPLREAA